MNLESFGVDGVGYDDFLESIFQDPCPLATLQVNGTRRATMPQVLTRRSEPIRPSTVAKRGHLHLQTQKLALVLVVITQDIVTSNYAKP